MIMLSKTSAQAINAFVELAKLPEGKWEGAARIARRIRAPQNYLGKLLQILASQGLVVSRKGLGGGFRLARDPEEITLYEIVEPIENVERWSACALGLKRCSEDNPCAVHHRVKAVKNAYLNFLRKTTVADCMK